MKIGRKKCVLEKFLIFMCIFINAIFENVKHLVFGSGCQCWQVNSNNRVFIDDNTIENVLISHTEWKRQKHTHTQIILVIYFRMNETNLSWCYNLESFELSSHSIYEEKKTLKR